MTSDPISEETKLTYDDRRKELTQIKSQVTENKTKEVVVNGKVTEKAKLFSTVNQSLNILYTEDGIRLAYKNLSNQKTNIEKRIAEMKKQELGEMPNDLKELKLKLEALQKYQKAEKEKVEFEMLQKNLKDVKTDLDQIKGTIGTRLKF